MTTMAWVWFCGIINIGNYLTSLWSVKVNMKQKKIVATIKFYGDTNYFLLAFAKQLR